MKLHLIRGSLIQFFRMTHFYWLNKDTGETGKSCETCFSSYCNSRHIILPSSASSWQKLQQSHDDLLSRNLTSHTSQKSSRALVCPWGTECSNLALFWSSLRKKSCVIKNTSIKVRSVWYLHCSVLSEDADFQLLTIAFLCCFYSVMWMSVQVLF